MSWSQFYPEGKVPRLLISGYQVYKRIQEVGREQNKNLAIYFGCRRAKISHYLAKGYKFGLLGAEYNPDDMRDVFYYLKPETEMALTLIDELINFFQKKDQLSTPEISQDTHEKRLEK